MRTFALLFSVLIAAAVTAQGNHPIKVRITDTQAGARLFVALYDTQEQPITSEQVVVAGTTTDVDLGPVPNGRYAVRVFQDENANGRLDLGMFRIPKEGVGCSNNVSGFMSAPAFKDMLFTVERATAIGIVLRHY